MTFAQQIPIQERLLRDYLPIHLKMTQLEGLRTNLGLNQVVKMKIKFERLLPEVVQQLLVRIHFIR